MHEKMLSRSSGSWLAWRPY